MVRQVTILDLKVNDNKSLGQGESPHCWVRMNNLPCVAQCAFLFDHVKYIFMERAISEEPRWVC